MVQVVFVNPPAGNVSLKVVGRWTRTLTSACTCALSIDYCENSVPRPRVPMKQVVRVNECSRDRSEGVDRKCRRSLASGCPSVRLMKCGELALTGAQKAVIYVVRVNEVACDRALVVDASSEGALKGARSPSGRVNRRDRPVRLAQEAVIRIAGIDVEPSNLVCPV